MIGQRGGGYNFKGVIDNVRIYNRALAVTEIQSDMSTPITKLLTPALKTGLGPASATGREQGSTAGPKLPKASDSLSPNVVSDLFCTPKIINAGSQATCELRMAANIPAMQIEITSSSEQVRTPAVVRTRANQTRLAFQVDIDAAARQQSVTVTAGTGNAAVRDTIQVVAALRPIVTVPGSQAAKRGTPVRFLVAAVDPADLEVQLTASEVPAGASFDAASGGFEWTPAAAQTGRYKVTFTATNAARQSSSMQVTIEVTSGDPTLDTAERMCSPGAVASLKGSWLAEPGSALSDPSGNAMDLAGTKVKVNGQYVPVLSASPTQVHFLCPVLDPETRLEVAVETASGVTQPLTMVMQSASPWIFSLDGAGQNQGVISFADSTELAMSRNSRVAARPAEPGDEIVIWGTGFGPATEVSTRTVLVRIGDAYAKTDSVRAVPGHVGVYTIQVRVPTAAIGDSVPVQVQVTTPDGKQFNSNNVTAAFEPVSQ